MAVSTTKLSRNGQVVIPKDIRERLKLHAGDTLIAMDVDGRIVLAPSKTESLRREFEELMGEFDRALRGQEPGTRLAIV
ncbi:MAG: AbrB/MazE/SpoVT family DNA-binding domain-containing protein, partial [Candidatus Thermoplasmatota archaeon]